MTWLNRTRAAHRARGAMALLLFASISWSVDQASDPLHGISRDDLNLQRDVLEIVVEEAAVSVSGSELREGARYPVERIRFDAEGFVTEWIEYDRSGEADSTIRYTYESGRLVLEEENRRWRWPSETIAFTHSASGAQTTAEVRGSDGRIEKTVEYERSADGKLTSITEFDDSGDELSRVVYTYSADGKRADRYAPDGEITSWSLETYDATGRLIKLELHTSGSEADPFTVTYELDSHGNVTLEETSGVPPMPFLVVTVTPSETKTRYEYTYDDAGNWTKRVESVWVFSDADPGWRATAAAYRTIRYAE